MLMNLQLDNEINIVVDFIYEKPLPIDNFIGGYTIYGVRVLNEIPGHLLTNELKNEIIDKLENVREQYEKNKNIG